MVNRKKYRSSRLTSLRADEIELVAAREMKVNFTDAFRLGLHLLTSQAIRQGRTGSLTADQLADLAKVREEFLASTRADGFLPHMVTSKPVLLPSSTMVVFDPCEGCRVTIPARDFLPGYHVPVGKVPTLP